QAIECRAGACHCGYAVCGIERVHIVPANKRRVPQIEREQSWIVASRAVPAVVQKTTRQCIELHRHEVTTIVDEGACVIDSTEGRRRFDAVPCPLHRARCAEI